METLSWNAGSSIEFAVDWKLPTGLVPEIFQKFDLAPELFVFRQYPREYSQKPACFR